MPLLCMKCDTRVEGLLTKPGKFWCPECDKELKMDDVYKVGKRFFQRENGELKKEKVRKKRKKINGLRTKQRRIERRKHNAK